jgi:hypothetical protein
MDLTKILPSDYYTRKMTKIKFVLLACFSILMSFQFLVGFRELDDYLVGLIFILFLNDLYSKIKQPNNLQLKSEKNKRIIMTLVFIFLLLLPFVFDSVNISNSMRSALYKFGFVLWAEIFLLDAFFHYQKTHSRQWLVFANLALLMIVGVTFIN